MPRKPPTGDVLLVRAACAAAFIELRTAAGIRQESLAYESGVDRSHMSGLERGLHSPGLDTIMKLLWRLDVSVVDWAVVFERHLKKLQRRANNRSKP